MKKITLSLLLLATSAGLLQAQAPKIETEKWNDKPTLSTPDAKYSKESAVILSDLKRVEFADDEAHHVVEYYTLHRVIHINDDRGIEEYNKIYLEFTDNADLVDVKARTILPGGRIVELDKKNIKDITEQNGNTYKIFALDGLEKGCDVEYFYTFKRPASYFGAFTMQHTSAVLDSKLQVVAPPRLRFSIKGYNVDQASTDTVLNGKRFQEFELKNIPGAEEEKYASYEANLKRAEYKLTYNDDARKGERLFTWSELAKRVYALYTDYDVKETAKVADLVKENGWDKLPNEAAKIVAVENYVKRKFGYDEHLDSEEGNRLSKVLQDKIGGTIGTQRLYSCIFKNLGVDYQFVLVCDRTKTTLDKDFENWNNCDYALLYFPAENQFLAPARPDYRMPWIPPAWAGGNGLYCKQTSLGSFSTAIAQVKPVPLQNYKESLDDIEDKLELTADLDSMTVDSKHIFTGYAAVGMRDAFVFSNDEEKKNIIKEVSQVGSASENLISSEVINPDFENGTTNKPLILHTKTRSGEIVEHAGNKLLVKIGLAIGQQVEMYQEKPRQQPIDVSYTQIEERKLDFVIPQGYTVSNLNDLKISQVYKENGELHMGFVSDYTINGNVLSVHIMEEYHDLAYPITMFEQFKKIINASSDFNKVVLVLEKKS